MNQKAKDVAECVKYIKVLMSVRPPECVADLLANVAYVYLSRWERLALAWRVFKTVFRN